MLGFRAVNPDAACRQPLPPPGRGALVGSRGRIALLVPTYRSFLTCGMAAWSIAANGCASTVRNMDSHAGYPVVLVLTPSAAEPGAHIGEAKAATMSTAPVTLTDELRSMGFTAVRSAARNGRDNVLVRASAPGIDAAPAEHGNAALAVLGTDAIAASAGELRRDLALFQLHRAIADGATDGLLIECGERTASECLAPVDAAALHSVLDRARAWGTALSGTRPATPPRSWTVPVGMKAVRLEGDSRELLFVRNSSMTRFARGVVSLSAFGDGFSRAIELVPSPSSPAGRVARAKDGRIEFELTLRPAGAALFRLR